LSESNIDIIIQATDDASGTIREVASNTQGSLNEISDASNTVTEATNKTTASSKQVGLAFNNVATSGFSLYMSLENVQRSQVTLDRANLMVERSAEAVEKAQSAYNAALAKYGADSPQAAAAAEKLKIATDAHEVALERQSLAQTNVNNSMAMAAMTVIPSIITMISSISTITESWTAVTEAAGGALDFLAANPIVLVVAGIAALVMGLIYAYNNCGPFRDAINAIASVLGGALTTAVTAIRDALKWLWDNVLVPLGTFLTAVFLAEWNALCNGFSWAYNNILKPVFDAIEWVWNNVLKPVADAIGGVVKAVGGVTGAIGNAVGGAASAVSHFFGFQSGGIVTSPTLALVGEAGPEAIIPLGTGHDLGLGNVNITLNVEGSVDRRTADYAVQRIRQELKNVIVEATSSQASSTHKRIRQGGIF
jgi:hypothetical protein